MLQGQLCFCWVKQGHHHFHMIHHFLFCCHCCHLVHTHLLLLYLHSLGMCLFLLVCFASSIVAAILSYLSVSSSSTTKLFHRLFPFLFFISRLIVFFFFCFLSVSLFALLVLFLMSYPSLQVRVKCEVCPFCGQCKCNPIDSLEVVWLVVIICCGIPVK